MLFSEKGSVSKVLRLVANSVLGKPFKVGYRQIVVEAYSRYDKAI